MKRFSASVMNNKYLNKQFMKDYVQVNNLKNMQIYWKHNFCNYNLYSRKYPNSFVKTCTWYIGL